MAPRGVQLQLDVAQFKLEQRRSSSTVGMSDRTPAKHGMMDSLIGREVGCAMVNPGVSDLALFDKSAGDGVPVPNDDPKRQEWHRRCSPGLMAYHARNPHPKTGMLRMHKNVRVMLYEKSPRTYIDLLENLTLELPALGYKKISDSEWICGRVRLSAFNMDGEDADLSIIGPRTAVMFSNDPNSIADWSMPKSGRGPECIRKITPWFQGIMTMGCNVSGLLRLPPEERAAWRLLVGSVIAGLPEYHDLYLAAIDRDSSRWGYLVISPNKKTEKRDWRAETEQAAFVAFAKQGMGLRSAWWRTDRTGFDAICDYLFRTARERGEAA